MSEEYYLKPVVGIGRTNKPSLSTCIIRTNNRVLGSVRTNKGVLSSCFCFKFLTKKGNGLLAGEIIQINHYNT